MAYGDSPPFVTPTGHVRLYRPDHPLANKWGHVMEHRMVAWDHGILTDPSDVVHHINHDPGDNRPENLQAMSHSAHASHHSSQQPKRTRGEYLQWERERYWRRNEPRTCVVCGRAFAWRPGKSEGWQSDPRACSNACKAILRRREGWRPAYMHDCENCGREFRSRMGDARFCGNKCRAAAARWGNDPCTAGLAGGG